MKESRIQQVSVGEVPKEAQRVRLNSSGVLYTEKSRSGLW